MTTPFRARSFIVKLIACSTEYVSSVLLTLGCLCVALGKKRKMSTELDELKTLALALYEDHPNLEIAHKALNSATADSDDRMQSLQTEVGQLESDIAELKRSRKRGSSGGSNRPAQKPRAK